MSHVFLLISETPSKRHWSVDEEVAVKRGVSKFGAGSWKEIKEGDPTLANRSPVQIKEKVISLCSDMFYLDWAPNSAALQMSRASQEYH